MVGYIRKLYSVDSGITFFQRPPKKIIAACLQKKGHRGKIGEKQEPPMHPNTAAK